MKLLSQHDSMIDSAAMCPSDANIKLIVRHSERYPTKIFDVKNQDVSLTAEGRNIARQFGASLGTPIGSLTSGWQARCVQTCEEIMNGSEGIREIIKTETLVGSHVIDTEKNSKLFTEIGAEGVITKYANGEEIEGLRTLSDSVEPILDLIFATGNKQSTVDIFCTHGFHMAQFLLYIFGCDPENRDEILGHWPGMMEGLFLWGTRDCFYAVWRGDKRAVLTIQNTL